jgi:hypothetical protein
VDLDERIDALYAGDPDDFVRARDALVRELKQAKDVDAVARVKALRRPVVSAWVVNELWRREPDAVAALLTAGDRMRRGDLSAAQPRREALAELMSAARALLREAGIPEDPHLERVRQSLANLSAWGTHPPFALGQLTEDVRPPDLEELLVAPPPPRDLVAERRAAGEQRRAAAERVRRQGALDEARAALAEAEAEVARARERVAAAEAALAQLAE